MTSDYLNAEYGVIGSLLIDAKQTLPIISAVLKPDDFSIEINKQIYQTALELQKEDACVDPMTIMDRLKKSGSEEICQYLIECMDITPTAANVEAYIGIVKNASMLRSIKSTASLVQTFCEDAERYEDALSYAVDTYTAIQQEGAVNEIVDSAEATKEFYNYRSNFEKHPEAMFVKTGFDNLDSVLGGGMVNSGLYVIAARPGTGKTTIALNIADNIAEKGFPVLFVSLEMSTKQITAKRLARMTGIPYRVLLMGKMDTEQYTKMAQAVPKITNSLLKVNRKPGASVAQIESMVRKIKGVRCVVVDYLGLVRPSTKRKSRYEEATEISWALKSMAIRLGIPVLCLVQLNRETEKEKGGKPKLWHLRDTGAIEQDADCVMLLHSQKPEAEESIKEWQGIECECIVAKNRHGETGVCKFSFYGAQSKLVPVRER